MKSLLYKRYAFVLILVVFCGFCFLKHPNNPSVSFNNSSLCINEIMTSNRSSFKDSDGDYESWVEIYNKSETAINLKGFGLTDDRNNLRKWVFPDVTIEGKSYLLIWTSNKNRYEGLRDLHTNFKLKASDEVLILSSSDGKWNNIVKLENISDNISYGRTHDGETVFSTFDNGTPGSSNNVSVPLKDGLKASKLDEPVFSVKGGIYSEEFYLTLRKTMEGVDIYYTTDGSVPTEKSFLYKEPIKILERDKGGTIIRAIACKRGHKKSNTITQSYFINNAYTKYNLPIVSLVSDPVNLFDYDEGILVPGKIYERWAKTQTQETINTRKIEGNFTQKGSKWERESNVEVFESGKEIINQGIGIRVFGGYSRNNLIKSLALFARHAYDDKDVFNIALTDNTNHQTDTASSKLMLRTPATDHLGAFFRDEMIQSLVPKTIKLDTQRNRTCIVFVNGEYYGIQNIKEPYNKDYFYNHYKIDLEDIVVLENPTGEAGINVSEGFVGDEMLFDRMKAFITSNDMKLKDNYEYVKTMMDMDNFIEYNILQLYSANRDWPGNNIKVWRKRTEKYEPNAAYGQDGRWRWLIFDMDYGFGLFKTKGGYEFDMISFATEANGPVWPNPPWSTAILRSLLENDEFRSQFIKTFEDRLNTIYKTEEVLKQIEYYKQLYYPYVEEHIKRWNEGMNISNWEKEIDSLKVFAEKRPDFIRQHIVNYFNLSGMTEINIDVGEGGKVKVNALTIDSNSSTWKGTYFKGLYITFQAIPEKGYVFKGWTGDIESKDEKISIELKGNTNLKALFSKKSSM
ncbi:hypothetical protein GCM10008905_10790 [Clostridium malenominatum]|uniref:LTD domain-containing protein n=1 Tax=Clostridium malenominatum TaxID=1539 RepID=A0ABN1ITF0_9CLOT